MKPTQIRTDAWRGRLSHFGNVSDFVLPTAVVETDAISPISLDAEDGATAVTKVARQ